MTARERKRYWIRERNKAIRIINAYKTAYYKALRADYNSFASAVEQGNGSNFASQFIISTRINRVSVNLYETIGVRYAKAFYGELRKEKSLGRSQFWIDLINQYLGLNFYNNGTLAITQTTQERFIQILQRSVDEGWGYYETARFIMNDPELDAQIRRRAEMIARTEVGKAIHAGTYVGADQSPFEKEKEWIAARDNRTRRNLRNDPNKADHWKLDGQIVDFNQDFTDDTTGVKMKHPHDPNAPAAQVVRCRCTYAVVNKRDENGRLIRKR